MLAAEGFVQVVPRFPERVTVCAPRGMRAALSRAAERENTTPAEFIRRILAEKLWSADEMQSDTAFDDESNPVIDFGSCP